MYNFLKKHKLTMIIVISISLTLSISWLTSTLLYTDDFYREILSLQLPDKTINSILETKKQYSFFLYPISVVLEIIKYLVITFLVATGLLIFGYKIKFKRILKIVVISDLILIIPSVLKILWFNFYKTNYSLQDLQLFYPLSILNLLNTNISNIWIYPLQLLNVFEISYWIALAYGISKLINNNFDKALKIVLSSYIPALVVWVVFVVFLTVTLNPA
ncbi:hypothetical protein N9R54_02840 [Pelobium sp.]|nr:hypothetical protein [Pelobium sp.]